MMRLPANISIFVVPALCLILLGAAWAIMRGGGESEETERPALRLLCEESLKLPIIGIVAAYERRGDVTVEVDFVTSSGAADRLAGKPDFHLVLLAADSVIADELIRQGLVVATESAANTTEPGVLRPLFVRRSQSPDLASGFVEFLSGLFATGILERHRAATGVPGL